MTKNRLLLACASLVLTLSTHTAHAVSVPPGSTVLLPGTTFAAEPQLGGVALVGRDCPLFLLRIWRNSLGNGPGAYRAIQFRWHNGFLLASLQ